MTEGLSASEDLARKLQLKGQRLVVLNAPPAFKWAGPTGKKPELGDAVLLFVVTEAEYQKTKAPVVVAAKRDDLAWIAYPKAGKLGTDLNRDILFATAKKDGIQAVRNVAVDDTWSALRFRPLK